jgi:hypothetical protein
MVDLSKFKQRMAAVHRGQQTPRDPVWKGPLADGITYSMLTKFMTCRERFRLWVVEGLKAEDKFDHKIEYGHMWHECERALSGATMINGKAVGIVDWQTPLKKYRDALLERFKLQNVAPQIQHWYEVCRIQFAIYQQFWAKHKDNIAKRPVCQEHTFDVPYVVGSGRVIRLRGKFDAIDLIGKSPVIYVQENKTKGDIEEDNIQRQLSFDCQTGMYLTAVKALCKADPKALTPADRKLAELMKKNPIGGVRYNVVRRPLSGGKGNIKKHAPTKKRPNGETDKEFYERLRSVIDGTGTNQKGDDYPGPEYFFMRWQAEIDVNAIERFERRFLRPILNQLWEWWDWIGVLRNDPWDSAGSGGIHWQHPFGAMNSIDEGYTHDLDEHLRTGSTVGLRRIDRLFEELDV